MIISFKLYVMNFVNFVIDCYTHIISHVTQIFVLVAHTTQVAYIAVYENLLWDLLGAFLHINLRFSRRRSFLHLDDQFSCCHWSLKKHKRVCLYLVVNPKKKESVDSELARGRVSKFYWWVAIRSQAWGLVSLIVWTSILSR